MMDNLERGRRFVWLANSCLVFATARTQRPAALFLSEEDYKLNALK